jgi:oligopeptide/dipeptide ABC transporter ATP-binding protein
MAIRNCGKFPRGSERTQALAALADVGFEQPVGITQAYPHQLSGGMRQRALLAMALAVQPRVLLADEPTTALDVSSRALVLACLERARRERQMAVLLISHDLGVLAARADRLQVMYAGRVVEQGAVASLAAQPLHPYTSALLAAIPGLDGHPVQAIAGQPPRRPDQVTGCAFAPRCPRADDLCRSAPPAERVFEGRHVACHHMP